MQSGLWSGDKPVPLVNVTVQGRIIDYIAEVTVSQRYVHHEPQPLEATFKFPLDLFGALCGFEVVLDGKQIIAQATKRQEAIQLSSEDVAPNDGSGLEQPDLFICNIGSLKPDTEVEFKLRYATELVVELGSGLRFVLPASTVSPNFVTETGADEDVDSRQIRKVQESSAGHTLTLNLTVDMPCDFELESPTHSVTIEKEEGQPHARVLLQKEKTFREGNFVLLFDLKNPHEPYSAVEVDPRSPQENTVAMISFFPQFTTKQIAASEIIFLVDCSNSMSGAQIEHVKSALQLLLRSLPSGTYFNIVEFGSTYEKLWPSSVAYNDETLEQASQHIKNEIEAELGGTDLIQPLEDIYSSPLIDGDLPRQLFVITDGQVPNTKEIFSLISKHSHNTRVFTFGIGDRVSHHLVTGMARAGGGLSEFVTGKEQLEYKVMAQLKRALQPALRGATLDWSALSNHVIQAPARIPTIFNGDRLLIYAFLDDAASEKEASVVTLKAQGEEGPVSFSVKVSPKEDARPGKLIHVLAARTRIRDLEENSEEEEEKIRDEVVRLGTTYGLASSYTSFVAVEVKGTGATPAAVEHMLGKPLQLHASIEIQPVTNEESSSSKPSTPTASTAPQGQPLTTPSATQTSTTTSNNNNNAATNNNNNTSTPATAAVSTSSGSTPNTGSPTSLPERSPVKAISADSQPFYPSFLRNPSAEAAAALQNTKTRKTYTPEFLMSFRELYKEMPDGMRPDVSDIYVSNTTPQRHSNKSGGGSNNNSDSVPRSPKPSRQGGAKGSGADRGGKGHKRTQSSGRGGALRASSGGIRASKDGDKNAAPVAPLVASENRWVRPTGEQEDENTNILRKAQGLLNKITLETFEPLSDAILDVGITNADILRGFIKMIFDKAVRESHFAPMYAQLCSKLSVKAPKFEEEGVTFRRLLLTSCQEAFERKEELVIPEGTDPLEREELEFKHKQRVLGNVKFVGELFKAGMLGEKVIHECIRVLLTEMDNPEEDKIESLCKLVTTVGVYLESPEAKLRGSMDEYFDRMSRLSQNQNLASRLRFALRDVLDLRANHWVPRRKENEAKTLAEARAEVEETTPFKSTPTKGGSGGGGSNASTPLKASTGSMKRSESREFSGKSGSNSIRASTGSMPTVPRSSSDSNLAEWETAKSGRKGGKGGQQQQGGWEVVGSARGGRFEGKRGGGRNTPEKGNRGGNKADNNNNNDDSQKTPGKDQSGSGDNTKRSPVRGTNLFSALNDMEDVSATSSPRSALKTAKSGMNLAPKKGVTIQEPSESGSSKAMTPEMVAQKITMLLEEFLGSADMEEAAQCLEELHLGSQSSEVIKRSFSLVIEKKERDREEMIQLLVFLLKNEFLTVDDFVEGFTSIGETIEDVDIDIPFASKYYSTFMGHVIAADLGLSLKFLQDALVGDLIETGKAIQIASGVLQTIKNLKGEKELVNMYQRSELDLSKLLKRSHRDTDYLQDFLKEKNLRVLVEEEEEEGQEGEAKDSADHGHSADSSSSSTGGGEESAPTGRPRRLSIQSVTLEKVILQQSAEGYWRITQEFAQLLNIPYETLQGNIPEQLTNNTKVWATVLAIQYLETKFKHKSDRWELIAKKANEWLDKELKEIKVSKYELREDAASFLELDASTA